MIHVLDVVSKFLPGCLSRNKMQMIFTAIYFFMCVNFSKVGAHKVVDDRAVLKLGLIFGVHNCDHAFVVRRL
jgi:hypothetical protein